MGVIKGIGTCINRVAWSVGYMGYIYSTSTGTLRLQYIIYWPQFYLTAYESPPAYLSLHTCLFQDDTPYF